MPSIIIIGSGPAGISAALYAVRAGVDTTVLTKGPGALDRAEKIENYYGFAEPVSGTELERRSIENAKRLGVRFVTAEAVGLTYTDKLTVETVDKNYPADAVIPCHGRIPGGAAHSGPCRAGRARRELLRRLRRLFSTVERTWRCWAAASTPCTRCRLLLPVAKSVALLTNGAPLTADFPAGGHSLSAGRGGCSGRNRCHRRAAVRAGCSCLSAVYLWHWAWRAAPHWLGRSAQRWTGTASWWTKNADHRARPVCGG